MMSARSLLPGNAPKHGPTQNRGRARVGAVIETGHLAGRIETRDSFAVSVDHLTLGVDLDATEGEAIAADHWIRKERSLRNWTCPVRFAWNVSGLRREAISLERLKSSFNARGVK